MVTAAQLAELRRRFAITLLSRSCQRIRFRMPGLDMRPGAYTVIGMSLGVAPDHPHGHGARRVMSVRVAQMHGNAEAVYRSAQNEIVVPNVHYAVTVVQRQAVVHEATHAVLDYQRTRLGAVQEEAAAYIAGAIYEKCETQIDARPPLVRGAPGLQIFGPNTTGAHALPDTGVFGVAASIAEGLVGPQHAMAPQTHDVTQAQLDQLCAAIRELRTYRYLRNHPHYHYQHDGGRL